MCSFQLPSDVSSAGCAATNTASTRDSADARMSVFRAFIDISPDLFLRPLGKCTRRRVYAPPDVLGQQRLRARYILKCAECGASLMMADRYKYARNGRPAVSHRLPQTRHSTRCATVERPSSGG